jgi:phage terminase large subunit-like protein
LAVATKRKRATARAPADVDRPRAKGRYELLYEQRHARDILTAPARGLHFDEAAGNRVVEFIERYCRHSKGEWAGQPIRLEAWQRQLVRILFGWLRADGTRRFRIAYVEIARKNAKSTLAAAIGLYLTLADYEPGAEVYASATKKDQAKIVHSAAEAMVKLSPALRKYLKTFRNNIHCPQTGSKFEPLGADSDTLDGLNPSGNIVDETHAHKDRALWDVLQSAQGARRQPLTLAITTAGVYDPEGIGWQLHHAATQVLEGAVEDDRFFAFVATMDEGDDWTSRAAREKANPNLGVSVKEVYLAEECATAQREPSAMNAYLCKHLDVWTAQALRWIRPDDWTACGTSPAPLDGQICYGGLDLSTKLDMTAFVAVAGDSATGFDCLFRFWVPEALVQARERRGDTPSYHRWVEQGLLFATPGNVIDYAFIEQEILALAKRFRLVQIGFDPWNANQTAVRLQQALNPANTKTGFQMVEMRQGMQTLSEPAKEFEKLVVSQKLRHGGHPIMRWMVANVTTRQDANGNIAPDKSTSTGKIDGVVATILALGRAIVTPHRKSVYEDRGLVEVEL